MTDSSPARPAECYSEHRLLGCISICTIRLRWLWPTDGGGTGRVYHVRCHCHPDRVSICWHVHRSQVWFHLMTSVTILSAHVVSDRFMIGFGLTFAASAAPVLVTELAYPSQRAPITSLYNTLWSVHVPYDLGVLSLIVVAIGS